MKKKPLVFFIALSTAAIVLTLLIGIIIPEQQEFDRLEIESIDLSRVPDGTYYGRAETIMAAAKVIVIVENQRIVRIDLVKHVHSNGEVAEAVLDRVLDEQCLQVDVIAGATTSSLVLLKAVEDALIHKQVGRNGGKT